MVGDVNTHGRKPSAWAARGARLDPGLIDGGSAWEPEETTMSGELEANAEGVDFALVAYREDGVWQVRQVEAEKAADLDGFAAELRRYPGEGGSLGLISIDEDFFVMVRVLGARTSILLSDVTAASDWPIARSVIAHLDLPLPDDDEDQEPAGDLGIVADLGMGAMDMGALLDDYELYPDEMLGDIAARIGFGSQYDELVGVTAS
jgi:putative tRNA adenosine deaminase-associated protein